MKLIDAEALKDDGSNYVWSQFADGSFIKKEMRFVNREQIDNAPTIEAIPIEWIKKWIPKNEERYALGVNPVRDLLEDWEAENG